LERGLAAAEQDHELQLVGVDAFQRLCQAGYLEKPKPFGERKVHRQEPVPLKRTQRYRKKRLAVTEADRSNGAAGKELVPPRRALERQDQRTDAGRQAQLVQLVRHVVPTRQIE